MEKSILIVSAGHGLLGSRQKRHKSRFFGGLTECAKTAGSETHTWISIVRIQG